MWMHDADQSRFAKRVTRSHPWKPEWLDATPRPRTLSVGAGGDVLPAKANARVARRAVRRGNTGAAFLPTPFRLRLQHARPVHRG